MPLKIHPTAEISEDSSIGDNTFIWHHVHIREGVVLGSNCVISKGVYLDAGVKVGNNVKIQNYVSVYHGVVIEDGVFVGPHVCFTNDKLPRAVNPDESVKSGDDWEASKTLLKAGCSIGANSTILTGVTIGKWALIGSGSVVTKNVPDFGLVIGNPARLKGFVCKCASRLEKISDDGDFVVMKCKKCDSKHNIFKSIFKEVGC